jgi:hypothetical protein
MYNGKKKESVGGLAEDIQSFLMMGKRWGNIEQSHGALFHCGGCSIGHLKMYTTYASFIKWQYP